MFSSSKRLGRLWCLPNLLFNGHRDYFPRIKRPEREPELSPPFNAGVKNVFSYTSTASIRLHGLHRDNSTLKNKVVPVHDVKAYRGSRGIAPLIIDLRTRWRWLVNFKAWLLYQRERTAVDIEQEAGWAPEPVWKVLQKGTNFSPHGIQTPVPPSLQLVATRFYTTTTKFTAKLSWDGSR